MEKKDSAKAKALKALEVVRNSNVILTREDIVNYIVMFVDFVITEITAIRKLYVSKEVVTNDVVKSVLAEKPQPTDTPSYNILMGIFKDVDIMVRAIVFHSESDKIISSLKAGDLVFAQHFFYDTAPKGLNMSQTRSKIIYEIYSTYKVKISPNDFSSIIYEYLWSNGTWAPIDTFKNQSSFFCWLEKVARHAIISYLEELGWINVSKERTTSNTRLKMLSQYEMKCKFIIDEVVTDKEAHALLTKIYVDRKKEDSIKKEMKLTDDAFMEARKRAEVKLKEGLLNTFYDFDDVLSNKESRTILVSTEYVHEFSEWLQYKFGESSLKDVFGMNLADNEIQDKALELLHDISNHMDWADDERYLWEKRYFEDESPEKLAKELGIRRSNVDVRYSRLSKKFDKAMKEWWKINCNNKSK